MTVWYDTVCLSDGLATVAAKTTLFGPVPVTSTKFHLTTTMNVKEARLVVECNNKELEETARREIHFSILKARKKVQAPVLVQSGKFVVVVKIPETLRRKINSDTGKKLIRVELHGVIQ